MTFRSDIRDPQRMNLSDFDDALTFLLDIKNLFFWAQTSHASLEPRVLLRTVNQPFSLSLITSCRLLSVVSAVCSNAAVRPQLLFISDAEMEPEMDKPADLLRLRSRALGSDLKNVRHEFLLEVGFRDSAKSSDIRGELLLLRD